MKINPELERRGGNPVTPFQDLARARAAAGQPLINFAIGDPREKTPEFIRGALKDAVPEVSQYPLVSGLPELRVAIAEYVGRRFGVDVDPNTQVLPTRGSKEAIFSTPLAFIDRLADDAVFWASPGYPVYASGGGMAGAETVAASVSSDLVLRPEDLDHPSWPRARLLWTCYPNNPTGAVASRRDLRELYEHCRANDTILCADDVYTDLYESEEPVSALEVADGSLTGVLSYLSLSKRSGMTGYRTGAMVGDAEALAALRMLRTSTGTAPTEFVQAAAIAAWSDDDHVAERRKIFAEKRAIVRSAFDLLPHQVMGSEAGLYLWVHVDDDLATAERLLDAGVVVTPGRAFGPGGEGHIRLALVPTIDECHEAAEVVRQCLTEN